MVQLTCPSALIFSSKSFLRHILLLLQSNNYSMFIFGIVFSFTNLILDSSFYCLLVISKGQNMFTGQLMYVGIFYLLLVIRNLHHLMYPSLLLMSSSTTAALHRWRFKFLSLINTNSPSLISHFALRLMFLLLSLSSVKYSFWNLFQKCFNKFLMCWARFFMFSTVGWSFLFPCIWVKRRLPNTRWNGVIILSTFLS